MNRSRTWLLEQFGGMSADDLGRPATRSEADPDRWWSGLDHLLHLMSPEQQAVEAITRQCAGDEYPYPLLKQPNGDGLRPRDEFLPLVHQLNDRWLEEHRGLSLDGVVALGERIRSSTLQVLSELSPEQLAEPLRNMPWAPIAPTIGDLFLLLARHEQGHHQQVADGLSSRRAGT